MREFKRQRGFLTIAQNSSVDYVRLSYGLALSLLATQNETPWLSIIITPGTTVPEKYLEIFDEVISVPWGDAAEHSEWKLENEWKTFHVTPYEETIKLDADMLFSTDVSGWWDILSKQDVWACTTVETYRGEMVTSPYYREVFRVNSLPNVYTAFMYFKANDRAQELFELVETIWKNWDEFSKSLSPETRQQPTTDLVFAMAIKILGEDRMTYPNFPIPRFVHMKSRLQDWPDDVGDDWTNYVDLRVPNDLRVMIGRFTQTIPVHYHLKHALTDDIIARYERQLGI